MGVILRSTEPNIVYNMRGKGKEGSDSAEVRSKLSSWVIRFVRERKDIGDLGT
jgi:hypothetical protein